MTGCGIMSSVWGMILHCYITIKVSIEVPFPTRHCRDMTDKLLKATLNQNKQYNHMMVHHDTIVHPKCAEGIANNVDLLQEQSDLDVHCLLRACLSQYLGL